MSGALSGSFSEGFALRFVFSILKIALLRHTPYTVQFVNSQLTVQELPVSQCCAVFSPV